VYIQTKPEPDMPKMASDVAVSPDVAWLRSKVDKISDEVAQHRGRLDEVSTRQRETAETASRLQADVMRMQSEIGSIADQLTSTLDQTRGELQQLSGRLNELSTQHGTTAEAVDKLHTDVTKIQAEVGALSVSQSKHFKSGLSGTIWSILICAFEMCERTERQTADCNTWHPCRGKV